MTDGKTSALDGTDGTTTRSLQKPLSGTTHLTLHVCIVLLNVDYVVQKMVREIRSDFIPHA